MKELAILPVCLLWFTTLTTAAQPSTVTPPVDASHRAPSLARTAEGTSLPQRVAAVDPQAKLPALPADGSGIYRLQMPTKKRGQVLHLTFEATGGRVRRAVARPMADPGSEIVWPVDPSGLTVAGDRVTGSVSIQVMPQTDTHPERLNPKDTKRDKLRDYRWEPLHVATLKLDVACKGKTGSGTYAIDWGGDSDFGKGSEEGAVTLHRGPARPLPERYELDLFLYAGLGDMVRDPRVFLRAAMVDGRSKGVVSKTIDRRHAIAVTKGSMTLVDGALSGRVEGTVETLPDRPMALELTGEAIGRQLWGTATLIEGDARITTSWYGTTHAARDFRAPLDFPRDRWEAGHSAEADPELAAQAKREALQPVMPGEPGKRRFRTWRKLAWRDGKEPVSVIYAPSFGIAETDGAHSYRYTVSYGMHGEQQKQFTADKPWRPLVPIWNQLEPGECKLVVTPLDADGQAIAGPMRVAVMERGERHGKEPVGWTHLELNEIPLAKRPSFSGPYCAAPDVTWRQCALDTARWWCQMRFWPPIRGQGYVAMGPGGENGFAYEAGPILWAWLAKRSLGGSEERLAGEQMLPFIAGMAEQHQQLAKGMFYGYKGYTPLSRWFAEPAIDAYLQTGDERWREIVLTYARRLATLQRDDGSFGSMQGKDVAPWGVFADWPAGNPSFGTAELLYVLGRIRHELKTEEFLETERRALAWQREVALVEQYWPLCIGSSGSQGYPVKQHAMTPLFFARYLLEYARPEDRDLELVDSLARCAEDMGVNWARLGTPELKTQVTPYLTEGGRNHVDAIATHILAALVFERLGRQTDAPLWTAKGEALARAVLAARNPENGFINHDLAPDTTKTRFTYGRYDHESGCRTWAIQLMREYAELKEEAE